MEMLIQNRLNELELKLTVPQSSSITKTLPALIVCIYDIK
jgi:hypothetical protein